MLRSFINNNTYPAGIAALLGIILLSAPSCKKYTDEPGQGDPRLSRKYCNDPEAVNFNRDFPGTADNSVCFYPADAYQGSYKFIDSIYNEGNKLLAERLVILNFSAIDKNKISLAGFCEGSSTPVTLTANRQLRAIIDTVVFNGQLLCRPRDTVSGVITQSLTDSTRLKFYLRVVSDTNITLHQGTAFRQ
jgi:hypothetical protein